MTTNEHLRYDGVHFQAETITLRDGSVEGHAAGCADVSRQARKHRDEPILWDCLTKHDVWEGYNSDFLAECEDLENDCNHDREVCSNAYDIDWKPCANHIPSTTTEKEVTEMSENVSIKGTEFRGCGCGCKQPVSGKANYRPGHDARHASQVGKQVAEKVLSGDTSDHSDLYKALPSDALVLKAQRIANKTVEKAQAPKPEKKVPADRKPSKTEVSGEPETTGTGSIKIGRWTYPVRMTGAGKVERNEKRDGSGSWLPVKGETAQSVEWE